MTLIPRSDKKRVYAILSLLIRPLLIWYNTDMTASGMIGRLKALKKSVLADGQVDWDETERLLAVIRPLAAKRGFLFQDYERLLEKCREDGQITKEESENLVRMMDALLAQDS